MKPSKTIWYISHYIAPPEFDTHSRATKFAGYLNDSGYDVTIFSASYLHNKNINLIDDRRKYIEVKYGNVKFVFIKTRKYSDNGFSRVYSLLQFSLRIYFLRNKFPKPDIIIHTAQVPFENFTYFTAKKLNAKYIAEVLDLWPESFVAYGILSRNNPFTALGYMAEKWLYRRADKIIFSMEGGRDYIQQKGWDLESGGPVNLLKIHYINNGVDLQDFDQNMKMFRIEDSDLLDDSIFKVIYLGSIRQANNIKKLIDAANILKDHKNIKFLIYGDGNERGSLEEYCRINDINNVTFKQKWIELKYVPFVLSKSSLNIINYMQSAILQFGGSQGKLFQYLASGKPICSNIKMGYCIITKYKAGISGDFKNSREYADSILSVATASKEVYAGMCKNARSASEKFDYAILSRELVRVLEKT